MNTPKSQNSFKVVNSNDLSVLAAVCAEIIASHPLSDPMTSEIILVMNGGMQTYLSQEIALRNGISSGIEYQQIWVFIWDLYKRIFNETDPLNRFSRDSMAWSLLGLKQAWSGRSDEEHDNAELKSLYQRFKNILKPLTKYVEGDDETGLKTWQLCYRIADTFDQYQMNRPEWIIEWNSLRYEDFDEYIKNPDFHGAVFKALKNASPKSISTDDGIAPQLRQNDWQPLLWLMIRENLRSNTAEHSEKARENSLAFMDRVQVMDRLCALLADAQKSAQVQHLFPARVFIMGVSAMPEQVVQFFKLLGQRCDVYLLLINPCREYWGDIDVGKNALQELRSKMKTHCELNLSKTLATTLGDPQYQNDSLSNWDQEDGQLQGGNALLTAMGRQGRDLLSLLLNGNDAPDFINCFVEPKGGDVLSVVKRNLLSLDQAEHAVIKADDDSMVFSSCHTPRREIEELRDMILEKFAKASAQGKKLLPRDILVMTPNIENYAAQIDAVFGSIDSHDPNYIPYAVGDRNIGSDSPVSEAVLKLLDIGTTPVTLSFVNSLLQVPEIASSFDISEEDAQVIARWCDEARIKWGLDADETLLEANVSDLPWTFEAALRRMLEGAILGEDLGGCGEIYDEIEGSDLKILGRFEQFISVLRQLRILFKQYGTADLHLEEREVPSANSATDELKQPMLLRLGNFFRSFIHDPTGDGHATEFIKTLGGLVKILPSLKHVPCVTMPILRSMLTSAFSGKLDETSYLRGSVNFCSLMPMRAVPFKHIFILGLNDGEFPRRENAPGFNLLTLSPFFKRGDRSRFVDDRYLFLEAILAAKESITFSYIGSDPIDNKPRNPSAVISELFDHLNETFCVEPSNNQVLELKPSEHLTRKARLNSYDLANFTKNTLGYGRRLPSFNKNAFVPQLKDLDDHTTLHKSKVNAVLCADITQSSMALNEHNLLTLDALRAFFTSPCKAYLNALGIKMTALTTEESDDEDFTLPLFEKACLIKHIVHAKDTEEVDAILHAFAKAGRLPYGIFAEDGNKKLIELRTKIYSALSSYENEYKSEEFFNPQILDFSAHTVHVDAQIGVGSDAENSTENSAQKSTQNTKAVINNLTNISIELSGVATFPSLIIDPFHKDFSNPNLLLDLAFASLAQTLCDATKKAPKQLVLGVNNSGAIGEFAPFSYDEAQTFLEEAVKWYVQGLLKPLPLWTASLKDTAGIKVEDFGYDEQARFIFRSIECLDPKSEYYDESLAAQKDRFYQTFYKPFVLEHCQSFVKIRQVRS